jgi:hypothetical protein
VVPARKVRRVLSMDSPLCRQLKPLRVAMPLGTVGLFRQISQTLLANLRALTYAG